MRKRWREFRIASQRSDQRPEEELAVVLEAGRCSSCPVSTCRVGQTEEGEKTWKPGKGEKTWKPGRWIRILRSQLTVQPCAERWTRKVHCCGSCAMNFI